MRAHRTKHQAVYEHLRIEIMSGALPPGARITIRDLAVQLGVSEIPVREAIKQLEIEGLMQATPYMGVQVSRLSDEDMREIAEMREALEPYATRLAAQRISEEELQRLQEAVRAMEEAVAAGDADRYRDLNWRFHEIVYEAAGNRKLSTLIFSLWENVGRQQAVFKQVKGILDRSLPEHQAIYQALRLGDPDLAARAMAIHRRRAMDSVKRMTALEGAEPDGGSDDANH